MQSDKITLGIPVYNASDLIERSLISALNQTYPDIEYILVDDKGDSMDIVRQVLESHPRGAEVRVIEHEYNRGIGAARNSVLDAATGKYLFTMDCDDTITPDCIEKLHAVMIAHPVDFVAASFLCEDVQGRLFGGCHYSDRLIEGTPGSSPVAMYCYGKGQRIAVPAWNKLYSLDFLRRNRIRCKEGHVNEDPWFTYQVVLCADSCRLLPDVTLHYSIHPKSVSGQSVLQGYSEKIARQYVEIQQLKSHYIALRTDGSRLHGALLTDIMKMSLYHCYRIMDSPQLTREQKNELGRQVLEPDAIKLSGRSGGRRMSYYALRWFFACPTGVKLACVRAMVRLNLKQKIRRLIHF